ncbi:MAG: LemA family protein [Nanoarchaeota archaeon]|nr:LemA family protein [Nanoarchaeota archaeon]
MALGTGIIVAVAVILFLAIVVGYFVSIFNGLVRLKNNIKKSWSNIDVLLKQRHDELPKLIASVKGYMAHEQGTLRKVTEARTAFMSANTVAEKAKADNMLSGALKSLFAVAENYPNLKANENFMQLQARISGLENEIADRREFYNDSTNTYNIKIQSFPDMIIARMMNYQEEEMFKVAEEDKQDVEVKF